MSTGKQRPRARAIEEMRKSLGESINRAPASPNLFNDSSWAEAEAKLKSTKWHIYHSDPAQGPHLVDVVVADEDRAREVFKAIVSKKPDAYVIRPDGSRLDGEEADHWAFP
jgi:hypothetical protein